MSRPVTFSRFVAASGLRMTPGQRVLVAVSCDGRDPADLPRADREIARTIFGDVEHVPPGARGVAVWKKGARIGGTRLGALRMLHLALTVPLASLAPGEQAFAIIVAPDLRLARQALRYVTGAIEGKPELAAMVATTTSDSVTLRRPDGQLVAVECLPASRGGSSLRGRSLAGALLTEASFFRDDSGYVVNDAEIFRAVAPRVLAGGQVVIESTPWSEQGLVPELVAANHGRPTTAIAAHCPTLVMRDDPETHALVARERARDPENASREFDAIEMPAGSGLFFDAAAVDACIVPEAG